MTKIWYKANLVWLCLLLSVMDPNCVVITKQLLDKFFFLPHRIQERFSSFQKHYLLDKFGKIELRDNNEKSKVLLPRWFLSQKLSNFLFVVPVHIVENFLNITFSFGYLYWYSFKILGTFIDTHLKFWVLILIPI